MEPGVSLYSRKVYFCFSFFSISRISFCFRCWFKHIRVYYCQIGFDLWYKLHFWLLRLFCKYTKYFSEVLLIQKMFRWIFLVNICKTGSFLFCLTFMNWLLLLLFFVLCVTFFVFIWQCYCETIEQYYHKVMITFLLFYSSYFYYSFSNQTIIEIFVRRSEEESYTDLEWNCVVNWI